MKRKHLWHRWLQWLALDAEAPQGTIAGCRKAAHGLLRAVYLWLGWRPLQATEEKGSLMIGLLVTVGILATVMTPALAGLSTGSISVRIAEERTTAHNIARSQLEYTMNETFCSAPCSYATIATPSGFTVTSEAQPYDPPDPNLETIVVTVYHDSQLIVTIEGIKANR